MAWFVAIQPYFKSCEHVCFAWGLDLRGLGWVFGQYDVAYSPGRLLYALL